MFDHGMASRNTCRCTCSMPNTQPILPQCWQLGRMMTMPAAGMAGGCLASRFDTLSTVVSMLRGQHLYQVAYIGCKQAAERHHNDACQNQHASCVIVPAAIHIHKHIHHGCPSAAMYTVNAVCLIHVSLSLCKLLQLNRLHSARSELASCTQTRREALKHTCMVKDATRPDQTLTQTGLNYLAFADSCNHLCFIPRSSDEYGRGSLLTWWV